MDPITAYEVAKLRMAERHQEAARTRMATGGRSLAGIDGRAIAAGRRWTVRRLVGQFSQANLGA